MRVFKLVSSTLLLLGDSPAVKRQCEGEGYSSRASGQEGAHSWVGKTASHHSLYPAMQQTPNTWGHHQDIIHIHIYNIHLLIPGLSELLRTVHCEAVCKGKMADISVSNFLWIWAAELNKHSYIRWYYIQCNNKEFIFHLFFAVPECLASIYYTSRLEQI